MFVEFLWTMASVLGTLCFVTINALIFALVYAKVMGGQFSKAAFKPLKPGSGVRFGDVCGMDEAKREAVEVVDFLRCADDLVRLGARVPRGILLVGPPGTGKTLLARAIANEAGVPFYACSGSDFNEVFVGVGASRLRKLFAAARKHPAAIVFIDEIDALGRARSFGQFGGQEHNNTLNALLVELDGFSKEGKGGMVIVVGATNAEESLDTALLRPGRFDRKLHVGLPTTEGRREILAHYLARVSADDELDAGTWARATGHMSGADLAALVNEATIFAVRAGRAKVTSADMARAIERLGIGQERAGGLLEGERRLVAYHEAGHAVVAHRASPGTRLHKVSIVPTGRSALGYTWSVPTEDRQLTTRTEFMAEIAGLFGGRVAEELVFGHAEVTGGAASDLARAAKLAERMVYDLGFAPGFPGAYRDVTLSEATRRELDAAMGTILDDARTTARTILLTYGSDLDALASALLVHEALDGPAVTALLGTGTGQALLPRVA